MLDASLLLMPLIGFVVPDRPEVAVDAARRWTRCWCPTASCTATTPRLRPTGCSGSEGTFSLCTFFYVDALARSGRLEDARLAFEKMLTYANHVGLFAEEIGPTGEQLGQLPAGVHATSPSSTPAINLDYQLDHGAGLVERRLDVT